MINSVGSSEVRAAIGRAAARSGIDFNYLLGQARLESGLDPNAKAGSSSASGLYQFVDRTWLGTLARHGAEHGLGWAAEAINQGASGKGVADPAVRAQIMALRFDPETAATMAGEFASDNQAALRAATGKEPGPTELYLAHFLGPTGAIKFLEAADADPAQSAASLFPKAAGANRSVFFDHGTPRSIGSLRDLISARIGAAMNGRTPSASTLQPISLPIASAPMASGPIAASFHAFAAAMPSVSTAPRANGSMAETLRSTFALDSSAAPASGQVRAAYDRLRSFGL